MNDDAVIRLVAARCLAYPDEALYAELPLLREAVADIPQAKGLAEFLDHLADTDPLELAAHYSDTFDTRNRRCLYLTWWTDGDTRRRGLSLVRIKRIYRQYGLEFGGEELPDFLPAALEFAGQCVAAGTELLQEHRAGLELLRLALESADTPYTRVVEAVCATLPGPSPRTREEAKALARSGPPRELVGLGAGDGPPTLVVPDGLGEPDGPDGLGGPGGLGKPDVRDRLSGPDVRDRLGGLEPRGPGVELPWPVTRPGAGHSALPRAAHSGAARPGTPRRTEGMAN
ncbi:nitrate reductase molybdenum cofactor assembly chaperone [Streptomyces sp. NPDC046203]|uniref:nitrate reductase molybdenum cofactor assembly chaperone n=1 Tax=Streptomyces sp. NPDC046203 TaxID=3154602 RepID=UPI0033E7FA88